MYHSTPFLSGFDLGGGEYVGVSLMTDHVYGEIANIYETSRVSRGITYVRFDVNLYICCRMTQSQLSFSQIIRPGNMFCRRVIFPNFTMPNHKAYLYVHILLSTLCISYFIFMYSTDPA